MGYVIPLLIGKNISFYFLLAIQSSMSLAHFLVNCWTQLYTSLEGWNHFPLQKYENKWFGCIFLTHSASIVSRYWWLEFIKIHLRIITSEKQTIEIKIIIFSALIWHILQNFASQIKLINVIKMPTITFDGL